MRKFLIAAAAGLVIVAGALGLAQGANPTFSQFVAALSAAGTLTGSELFALVQGGTSVKLSLANLLAYMQANISAGGVPGTIVLTPSGGDDASQLNTALANYSTVIIAPGNWHVCSTVEVGVNRAPGSAYVTLQGMDNTKQGIGNLSPNFHSKTSLSTAGCSGGGTFSRGYLHMHDGTTLHGFQIFGDNWLGGKTNTCVDARGTMSFVIDGMAIDACYIGIDHRSSATNGDSGSVSQDAVIVHSTFNYNQTAYWCGADGGGNGCADNRIDSNECEVPGSACFRFDGSLHSQIINNRMEDGAYGVMITGSSSILIENNMFNRLPAAYLSGSGVNFVGNKLSGVLGEGGCLGPPSDSCATYGITFDGDSSGNIANNLFSYGYTAAYSMPSPATFGGNVSNNIYGMAATNTTYARDIIGSVTFPKSNAYIQPDVTSSTFAAPNLRVSANWLLSLQHGLSPMTLPCLSATDSQTGTLAIRQSPAGSDAITWNGCYQSTPTLSTTAYVTDYIPVLIAGGNVILGTKQTVAPSTNLITGGNAVTSGNWPTTNAALTGSITGDPIGTSTTTRMTEDAVNTSHYISQAHTLGGGNYTLCAWVKQEAGSRNVAISQVSNAPSESYAIFNPSDGSVVTTAHFGFDPGVSAFLDQTANGNFRVCMTTSFNFGAVATSSRIYMASGTSVSYTGDNGTSKVDVWGITLRAGSSP